MDSSGTFIRRREQRSDLARPPDVDVTFFYSSTKSEQRRMVQEYQEKVAKIKADKARGGPIPSSSSTSAAVATRRFTIELPKRVSSTFPPIEAPPPNAVIQRVVVDSASGEVLEDVSTVGWNRDDWHSPPEVPAGPCQVIYVYDERVHKPRGTSAFQEDLLPWGGLPVMASPVSAAPAPVGIKGFLSPVSEPSPADESTSGAESCPEACWSDSDDSWEPLSEDSDHEAGAAAEEPPPAAASTRAGLIEKMGSYSDPLLEAVPADLCPDDVDPWEAFDDYVASLAPRTSWPLRPGSSQTLSHRPMWKITYRPCPSFG